MIHNLYIAHEDRRVVITQPPKASGLKNGEILMQGDLPIHQGSPKTLLDTKPGLGTVMTGVIACHG